MPPELFDCRVKRRFLAVVADFVVQLGAAHPRRLEAPSDLDALDRLQAQQRMREASVELAIPLHVAAEADRQSGRDHLDDAAERVAGFLARVDFGDDRALGLRVGHPHLRFLGDAPQFVDRKILGRFRFGRADADAVSEHRDAERREQLLGQRADRDARGGLARRRAFEHVADVLEVVLQHAGEVGMTGARARDDGRLAAIGGIGRHPLLPILVVAILDDEGDRAAHRAPEADAGDRAQPHPFRSASGRRARNPSGGARGRR